MTEESEIWKDEIWMAYPNCPNYLISTKGRVISYGLGRNHLRKLHVARGGYLWTTVTIGGKTRKVAVHQLVAQTFIPNTENKPHIHHKNFNPADNSVENLEWCTIQENNAYNVASNRYHVIPVAAYNYKTGDFIGIYGSGSEAAKELNVEKSRIYDIVKGKGKQTKGYTFKKV